VMTTEWRNRFVREANQADSSTNTRAIDSLLNYETVKYFNNEEFEARTYDDFLAKWESAKLKNRMSLLALNSEQALIIALVMTTEWRNRFVREANQADSSTNTRAIDSLLNYETVKYFNNEEFEARTYDDFLAKWESAKLKNRMSLLALNSGQALIIALAIT